MTCDNFIVAWQEVVQPVVFACIFLVIEMLTFASSFFYFPLFRLFIFHLTFPGSEVAIDCTHGKPFITRLASNPIPTWYRWNPIQNPNTTHKRTYQEANFFFVTFNAEIYLILNVLMFLVCSLDQSYLVEDG